MKHHGRCAAQSETCYYQHIVLDLFHAQNHIQASERCPKPPMRRANPSLDLAVRYRSLSNPLVPRRRRWISCYWAYILFTYNLCHLLMPAASLSLVLRLSKSSHKYPSRRRHIQVSPRAQTHQHLTHSFQHFSSPFLQRYQLDNITFLHHCRTVSPWFGRAHRHSFLCQFQFTVNVVLLQFGFHHLSHLVKVRLAVLLE